MRDKRTNAIPCAPIIPALLFGLLAALVFIVRATASDQSIYVTVERSGCAINQPNEILQLSLWRAAQYPGDGSTVPHTTLAGTWTTTFEAAPGYYRVELASRRCWASFTPVAVLPGHSRHIRLKPREWVTEEHTLYTIFTGSGGAVVGQLKSGQSAPSLLRIGDSGKPDGVASLEPDGFYYFDSVSVGTHMLSIPTQKAVVRRRIQVKESKITVVPIL